METLENWQEKAEVLIEALPYIQRFRGKIIVVKYGGSAMVDHELKKSVIRDVALLKLVGFRPIIVHGGGKEITKWVNKAGLETNFVNGLRVTDKDTMEIAEMVLNKINKGLVSMMEKVGIHAVGISGKDGTTLRVDKKLSKGQDIGFVGEIKEVNTRLLEELLDNDLVPVVCPIGSDDEYHSYNINADDAACAIASAMGAAKLAFLTDIEGVYEDPLKKETLISRMTVSETEKFLASEMSEEECFQNFRTALMRLRPAFPEFIYWMEELHIVCCWNSLQIKVSVQQLLRMTKKNKKRGIL